MSAGIGLAEGLLRYPPAKAWNGRQSGRRREERQRAGGQSGRRRKERAKAQRAGGDVSVLVGRWRMGAGVGADLDVSIDPAGSIVAWATRHPERGVYEADRTYPGPRILAFDEHLDRLEASALGEGFPLQVDRERFRTVLRDLTARALTDIPIAAGSPGTHSVRFLVRAPESRRGEIDIVIEPFQPPSAAQYEHGVACATMIGARREHPEAKTSSWMSDRQAFTLPEGTYEGLLVSDDDRILEGATSNFYAVLDGELYTADRDVLLGIARQIVLEVAPDILPLRLQALRRSELPRVSEAFLTSSSRAVLPVSSIDGVVLGGRGVVTGRIASAYDAWVESHLARL